MIFTDPERQAWEPTPRLTMARWADVRRHVAKGPARGRWSSLTMPILDGIMDAFHETETDKIVVCGPTQAGKTEAGIVNPILYYCIEHARDTLALYPTAALAKTNWTEKIAPAIQASPELKTQMMAKQEMGALDSGRKFRKGQTLFMIGADSQTAGTSRSAEIILVDERNKIPFAVAGRDDPVMMAINRSDAYPETRRICLCSTITGPEDPQWVEYLAGDQRRPWVPCPRCGEFVLLLWDGMEIDGKLRGGMQFDQSSDVKARKSARWVCPFCLAELSDGDRPTMYRKYRWLKEGQRIDKAGEITGDPPQNSTASFWYNSLYCPWWSFGKLAALWVQTRGDPEKERDFQIHRQVIPYKDPTIEIEEVTTAAIRAHVQGYQRATMPAEADLLFLTADVHRRVIYYTTVAFRKADMTAWLVEEGVEEVWSPENLGHAVSESELRAILSALRELHRRAQGGWPQEPYHRPVKYQIMAVDHGYAKDAVERFVKEAGQRAHLAVRGYSTSNKERWRAPKWIDTPKAEEIRRPHAYSTLQSDGTRIIHSDADHAKRSVHRALQTPPGTPGALYLYPEVSHAFIKHLQAERWIDDDKGGHFEVVSNNNHFLDCMGMAYLCAELSGASLLGAPQPFRGQRIKRPAPKPKPADQIAYRRLNYRG